MVYRADFDPFGQLTYEWSASGNNNLNSRKFTGFERDATGLDYAQARTYGSSWGRFMQSDPMGAGYRGQKPNPMGAASAKLPQSHNRYSYVGNDPMTLTDPSGLALDPCCVCPGHGEGCEGREAICPTGGGGGQNCNDLTFTTCCSNQEGLCKAARGSCLEKALLTFGGAEVAACYATCQIKGSDSKECKACWVAPIAVLAAGLLICQRDYEGCIKSITFRCRTAATSTCKC